MEAEERSERQYLSLKHIGVAARNEVGFAPYAARNEGVEALVDGWLAFFDSAVELDGLEPDEGYGCRVSYWMSLHERLDGLG